MPAKRKAGSASAETQLKSFIAKFEPKDQRLIRAVRTAVRKRFPTANELVWDNYNFFVIGYSPTERPADSIARLGPYRYFASCYVCKAGEGAPYWRTLENELRAIADRSTRGDVSWGVTSLRAHGLVVRGVAVNGRFLSDGLVEFWRAAKLFLCGRAATLPRKVH